MTGSHRRAVFLDRDGVLIEAPTANGRPRSVHTLDQVVLLPGVEASCRRLVDAGWLLVVVSNQPDVARGLCTREDVEAINRMLTERLPVAEVVTCPHDDMDRCSCRKPQAGMLLDAASRQNIDLAASVVVGDRWRDIEAGLAAGVCTILVDHGYEERLVHQPDHVVSSLAAAAELIVDRLATARNRLDDWDSHWSAFADAATDNPAQAYRRDLILDLLRDTTSPRRLVDIGSGQGDLLAAVAASWPEAELAGVELSAVGIARASERVPMARFHQADLLETTSVSPSLEGFADVAVCSEVLEHVEDPAAFLRASTRLVAPNGRLIITVPGGPRTAFDRYIGHRRHFRRRSLRMLIQNAGLDAEHVRSHGFPFFNLYKLVVLLRGGALVRDASSSTPPSRLANWGMQIFARLLKPRLNSSRAGWQLVAVARMRRDATSFGSRSM